MQDNQDDELEAWKVAIIMVCSIGLITWIKQESLTNYWQQTYHNTAIWEKLASHELWQQGNMYADNQPMIDKLKHSNEKSNEWLNKHFYAKTLKERQEMLVKQQLERLKQQEIEKQKAQEISLRPLQTVTIARSQKVFFVGDSLMQGVAPWVMKQLQHDHNVQSINLSKQSTGLSYDKFLDWPLTVKNTFKDNPDIGLMVVFLGPNDPWAVPDPDKKGPYVEFNTPRWREIYHAKMNKLIDEAKQYNASIIWVTPPNAKKKNLNDGMIALRQIMSENIKPNEVLLLNGQTILGKTELEYTDSIVIDNKLTKVRSSDGVHFTAEGQKHIATAIANKIMVEP